jgi:CheY-like chemotaxis protein
MPRNQGKAASVGGLFVFPLQPAASLLRGRASWQGTIPAFGNWCFRARKGVAFGIGGNLAVTELPTILVVEDDQDIQGIIEEALTDGGFESAIAASGEEAVTLLRDDKTKCRVLVTDINLLGKLDGWDVARVAREIDPSFPVVYMSGKDADDWASKGVPNSINLAKPFAPAQLVTAVSQLLNSVPPATAPS